jgi:hypothetical protein
MIILVMGASGSGETIDGRYLAPISAARTLQATIIIRGITLTR